MRRPFGSRTYSNRYRRRNSKSRSRSRERNKKYSRVRTPPRRSRSKSRDRDHHRDRQRYDTKKEKRSISPTNKRPVLDLSPDLNLDKKAKHSRSRSPKTKKLNLTQRFQDIEKSDGWNKKSSSNLYKDAKDISIVIERKIPHGAVHSLEDLVIDFYPDKHDFKIPRRSGEGKKAVFEREEILKFGHDLSKPEEEERRRVVRIPSSHSNVEQKVSRNVRPIREYEDRLAPLSAVKSNEYTPSSFERRSFDTPSNRMSDRLGYSRPSFRPRDNFETPDFRDSHSGGLPEFSNRPDKGRVPIELLDPAETPRNNRYFLHDDRDTYTPRYKPFRGSARFQRRAMFNNLRRAPYNRPREREMRQPRQTDSRYPDRYRDRYDDRAPQNQRRYQPDRSQHSGRDKNSPLMEWRHDKFEELQHEEPTSSTDRPEIKANDSAFENLSVNQSDLPDKSDVDVSDKHLKPEGKELNESASKTLNV